MQGYSYGGRLAQYVSYPEQWSIAPDRGGSMNIATFLTRDLQEQDHKSYVASHRANEELVVPQMLSCKLCH